MDYYYYYYYYYYYNVLNLWILLQVAQSRGPSSASITICRKDLDCIPLLLLSIFPFPSFLYQVLLFAFIGDTTECSPVWFAFAASATSRQTSNKSRIPRPHFDVVVKSRLPSRYFALSRVPRMLVKFRIPKMYFQTLGKGIRWIAKLAVGFSQKRC